MSVTTGSQTLRAFLARPGGTALVRVAAARGSTPRESGTWMLVSRDATHGTIGGGQLEYMAIDKARQMLAPAGGARPAAGATMDVPLGPEIGQCCGGRVELDIRPVDVALTAELVAAVEAEEAAQPHVFVFGGGHVGKAMAAALGLLPVKVAVVDTRADELGGLPENVAAVLTPVPEEVVREAPSGSAFAVLTHDHALDFLIVAEALRRSDAAYVGMIGSKTKKATFRNWFLKTAGGSEAAFARLVSPIGGDTKGDFGGDKRPAVIAALAAAEIMSALVRYQARRPLPAPSAQPISPAR